MMSRAQWFIATYSDSADDNAMLRCRWLDHMTAAPREMTSVPEVDSRVSGQPAQSASAAPSGACTCDREYVMPRLRVVCRY